MELRDSVDWILFVLMCGKHPQTMDPMEINDAQVKNRLTLYETNEKLHSMQHFAKFSISLQTNTWDQLQLERALSSPAPS
jgi:hypothetical protein